MDAGEALEALDDAIRALERERDALNEEVTDLTDAIARASGELLRGIVHLHDEAHGDDKMPFRLCTRQSCRTLRADIAEEGLDPYSTLASA